MAQLRKAIQTVCCFVFICVMLDFVNAKKFHKTNSDTIMANNELEQNTNNNDYDLRLLKQSLASDPDALSTLRLQLLAQQLGAVAGDVASDDFDPFVSPSKRQQQLRFRQCYFNPISCFRK